LEKENTWQKKISEFKDLAEVLGDSSIKKSEHFAYLQSEKWKTSKLPFLKISIAAFTMMLLIVGGIIIGPKYWGENEKTPGENAGENGKPEVGNGNAGDSKSSALIIECDSLVNVGKQQYENKLYPLAKQTFQQALEIASKLDKSNTNELTKNRINDVNDWIAKCGNPPKSSASDSSSNNSSTPQPPVTQPPVTKTTPTTEESQKKEEADKSKAAKEAKLKAENEAKLKAEKDAAKKGAKTADEEWNNIVWEKSKTKDKYVASKEKAKEIWDGLKNKKRPSNADNLQKWLVVKNILNIE
jgi:hypothetical protein